MTLKVALTLAYAIAGILTAYRVACWTYEGRAIGWNAREIDAFMALLVGIAAGVFWPATGLVALGTMGIAWFADHLDARSGR